LVVTYSETDSVSFDDASDIMLES